MKYVLVILYVGASVSATTQEFNSEQNCESVKTWVSVTLEATGEDAAKQVIMQCFQKGIHDPFRKAN